MGKTLTETKELVIDFFGAFERGGINGQDGIIDTFFSKNKKYILTPELLEEFERFKKKFNDSKLSAEEMSGVGSSIVNYAKTCKNGELTTKGFSKALCQNTLSAKAATVVTKALAIAGNIFHLIKCDDAGTNLLTPHHTHG